MPFLRSRFSNVLEKMKLENNLNKLQLNAKIEKSALNLMDLPTEILIHVANFISSNKLKNFGLVNKRCNEIRQHVLNKRLTKCVDLRKFFYLNEKKLLKRVKEINFIKVNLNQCYYLSPRFIWELISRESVRELDLTECNCTRQVIAAVTKLNLTSLSFSLSKTWEDFFVFNQNRLVAVFQGLKKLEIYHRFRCRLLMSHVARYVLPHCRQLQCLKLLTPSSYLINEVERDGVVQTPKLIPTKVPNLDTLVLDFHDYDDLTQHIQYFLEVILHEKKIPLTNVNIGNETIAIVLSRIFRHRNISFVNADIVRLDSYSVDNAFDSHIDAGDVSSAKSFMPKCTKYKKISMANFHIRNCSRFTEDLVKSGNTSVEAISLNRCKFDDGVSYFIDRMSILCPGVTVLDLTLARWSCTLAYNTQVTNSDLMNSLSNLTNLRTLCIAPAMLIHKTGKEEDVVTSFYAVAKKCKSLRKLRIVGEFNCENLSQDVLSVIKFFTNLRELYLVNFGTFGPKFSVFSGIVEHCSKLKHLHIEEVFNERGYLELMLPYAKKIKHLYLDQKFIMTKAFVDKLSECTQLEKLYLSFESDQNLEVIKYFAESLKKFNKLQFFSTADLHFLSRDYFSSAYNEIKEIRPRFFFKNFESQSLPMAHHNFHHIFINI